MRAGALRFVRPHDMTHAPDCWVERVNRLQRRAHQRAHDGTQRQDPRSAQLVDTAIAILWLDDSVEIAPIRDINAERAELRHIDTYATGRYIGRHIADGDARDFVACRGVLDSDRSGRHFDAQVSRCPRANQPMLDREGDHPDRAMATHGQAATRLDEQDRRIVRRVKGRI